MFNSIKKIFGINKNIGVDFDSETFESNNFYPLSNSPFQLKSLSRTDYLSLYNGWVYAAITTISDSIGDLNYHLLNGSKSTREINHKYLKFINYEFLQTVSAFLKLNGECYVYKGMIGNSIDSLHILRPDLITIKQDIGGEVEGYIYEIGSKRYLFKREDLIIFKNFNPYQTFGYETKGIGDVQAIAIQAKTDNAINNWNWNFFKNNASAGDIIEAPEDLDNSIIDRFSSAWNNKFRGVNNGHKLAILTGGMKYIQNSRSQREMDFVEQRRFTRDEILGIFKVPKAIIGLGEGSSGTLNVKAYERVFAKRTIKPIATQIQETLNEELFKGIGYFEFINIIPTDKEELRKDLEVGVITLNEYRKEIGKPLIDGGNVLKLNMMQVSEKVDYIEVMRKNTDISFSKKSIENALIKNQLSEDDIQQKRWEKKIIRNDTYEKKYQEGLQKIFKIQEKDILDQINSEKKNINKPKWDTLKYFTLYHMLIGPIQRDLVEEEGNIAFKEIIIDAAFEIGNPNTTKWLRSNIDMFAKEIDNTTKNQIFDEIEKGNKEGLGASVISQRIQGKFDILKGSRSKKIVRTETIRAGSYATQKAWEDSNVVEAKQWWTARDERRCESCKSLHGKIIGLTENFYNKGDTTKEGLKLNYSDTPASPLHPLCRCSLIPIIKE